MWDAMNEPFPSHSNYILVTDTMTYIKSIDSSARTTWSYLVTGVSWNAIGQYSCGMARHADCDILSLHVYGQSVHSVQGALYDAVHVPALQGTIPSTSPSPMDMTLGKPIVINEIGYPGRAFDYRDAINFCDIAPRPDHAGLTGVGNCIWMFMIGHRHLAANYEDNHPLKNGTGMFYGHLDPTTSKPVVREPAVVQAFVTRALNDGVPAGSLWNVATDLVPVTIQDPYYVAQATGGNVHPAVDEQWEWSFILANPSLLGLSNGAGGSFWSADEMRAFARLFAFLASPSTLDLGVLGTPGTLNSNPFTSFPRIAGHLQFSGSALDGFYNLAQLPDDPGTFPAIGLHVGNGTQLDPILNSAHRLTVMQQFFQPYAVQLWTYYQPRMTVH
jgi:hypothetical protein